MEVLRSVPIMQHLLSRLQPADLAALAASCRAAAAAVEQELPLIQHSLEQNLRVSVAKLASNSFSVHQWSTTSIQIPSPCGSRCLMAMQDARSLTLEVLGHPVSAARVMEGQLWGMPRWSGDSSCVAVAVAMPQHAAEETAKSTGRPCPTLTTINLWNTSSYAWTSTHFSTFPDTRADLAVLYWAPTEDAGYRLAASARTNSHTAGFTRDHLFILGLAGASMIESIRLAAEGTEKEHAATLHWSPDSSRIALVVNRYLWVRSAISEQHLLKDRVAEIGQAVAWAPSGQWVLCHLAFVGASLEHLHAIGGESDDPAQIVPHSEGVAKILAACFALTWGAPGVVAVTGDALHIFSVKEGPVLIPEHTRSLAFDATWVRIRVTRCTFDWAPGGQWLLCLLQLAEKDGCESFTVLLVHPASGRTKSMPCLLRRAAQLSHNAALRLATASQWAPDACSAWVGVLDMDPEKPSAKDAFRQWLLRFK